MWQNQCILFFFFSPKDSPNFLQMYFTLSFFPQNVQNAYLIYSHFPTLHFCCTSFPNGPLVKEDNISLGLSRNTYLYVTSELMNGSPKKLQAFWEDLEESAQKEQFGICLWLQNSWKRTLGTSLPQGMSTVCSACVP